MRVEDFRFGNEFIKTVFIINTSYNIDLKIHNIWVNYCP